MAGRIAIVCAMEAEIKPLVRKWRKVRDRGLTFFESEEAVAVAAGIGSAPAALAAMALVAREQPSSLVSVGFAGALRSNLQVGDVLWPRTVINVATSRRFESRSEKADGILVSGRVIADEDRKKDLHEQFEADAIDMESAGIASVADSCGLPFIAVKVISDEVDFAMPPLNEFVDTTGRFHVAAFIMKAAVRPKWWGPTWQLSQNSRRASVELCQALAHQMQEFTKSGTGALVPSKNGQQVCR